MKLRTPARAWIAGAAVALAAGCGGSSSTSTNLPPGYYITISGLAFSPLDLSVPPGATVTVINRDGMDHSVTSEAAPSAFTPGAVAGVSFDTGLFLGQKSFTIPSSAAEGTVIHYFCRSHLGAMATPNGTVTIHASAPPSPPPGGGGGGGGGGY